MATNKKKLSLYVQEEIKQKLTQLARARRRSVNNLIEVICEEAIAKARKDGEI
jgi:hypothetical protein